MFRKLWSIIRNSPVLCLFLLALVVLGVLILRGLDFGPLHTDVLILRAWYHEFGLLDFIHQYFDVNQRHILGTYAYAGGLLLFGDDDFWFNFLIVGSRLLQGVFLTGIVWQLTRRYGLALVSGLFVMFSVVRVANLYQQVNWNVEGSLVILLASSYFYLVSLQQKTSGISKGWYALSFVCYSVSVMVYEAGFALGCCSLSTRLAGSIR